MSTIIMSVSCSMMLLCAGSGVGAGTVAIKREGLSVWDESVQAELVKRMSVNSADPGIVPPQKIKHLLPEYPKAAAKARIEGTVTIEARVDTRGKVVEIVAVTGEPSLAQVVEKTVRKWRYRPMKIDGAAHELRLKAEIVFSLTALDS